MFEAVLFDLDGTLADTAPDLGESANQSAASGRRPTQQSRWKRCAPTPRRAFAACSRPGSTSTPRHSGLRASWHSASSRIYAGRLCEDTRLFDGIPELLDALEPHDGLAGALSPTSACALPIRWSNCSATEAAHALRRQRRYDGGSQTLATTYSARLPAAEPSPGSHALRW